MSEENVVIEPRKKHRPDGVIVIAVYHFLIALPSLQVGLLVLLLWVIPVISRGAAVVAQVFALVAFLLALVFGIGAILAGIGLLQCRDWARWIAIVLAILSIPQIPYGTVIGGMILWYLLKDETQKVFTRKD